MYAVYDTVSRSDCLQWVMTAKVCVCVCMCVCVCVCVCDHQCACHGDKTIRVGESHIPRPSCMKGCSACA